MDTANVAEPFSVAAVVTACNCGNFIGRAIDSVLAQTRRPDEIIVVDDGSTDHTAQVIARYESNVRFIQQENAGASAARNAGIQAARSEWIALLDGDDEWLPEKLEKQIGLLRRNPALTWATANFDRCLCQENRRGVDCPPARVRQLLGSKEHLNDYFAAYQAGAHGHTSAMIIRRQALHEAGLFRVGQAKANDLDMWWRLAYRWPAIGFSRKPLAVYHMDVSGSITQGFFPRDIYCELIARHRQLAREHDRSEVFDPFAAHLLRRWFRALLFEARADDIRHMMREFDDLLEAAYKRRMRWLTAYPKTTAAFCHGISRFVRLFRLRRRIVSRPRPLIT